MHHQNKEFLCQFVLQNFPNNASNINPIQMSIMNTNGNWRFFFLKAVISEIVNATVANTIITVLLASHTNLDFQSSAD